MSVPGIKISQLTKTSSLSGVAAFVVSQNGSTFQTSISAGYVTGYNTLQTKQNNVVTFPENFIGGGVNNTISSNNSAILGGSNNTIQTTHDNSFIVGNNLTSTQPNTIYTNNIISSGTISGTTISGTLNLTSPDSSEWALSIDNNGTLITTKII
jgi:hypothetical protein